MRRLLLAEDPGIRGAGVGLFDMDAKTLLAAAYVKSPCTKGNQAEECRAVGSAIHEWALDQSVRETHFYSASGAPAYTERKIARTDLCQLVAEWPLIVDDTHQKGSKRKIDKNDLTPLAGVSSAFAMAFAAVPVKSYTPREWKGTIDPDMMTWRIHKRLSAEELERVTWTGQAGVALGDRDPTKGIMHNVFDAIGIGLHFLGRLKRRRGYAGLDG